MEEIFMLVWYPRVKLEIRIDKLCFSVISCMCITSANITFALQSVQQI